MRNESLNRREKYFSKVVGKALEILELVRISSAPLTLKQITNHVGTAKSSVFRILYTLEAVGYVKKDRSGHYTLSTGARPRVSLHLVEKLVEIARPRMLELRRRFSETVSMGVLFDNHIEVVAVVESARLVRMGNTVGRILPPHASSMGKAICAFQPEFRCERLLRSYGLHRFSKNTITDEIRLKQEYETIRKQGWSLDNAESTEDGFCFGVPVFADNRVIAAISISVPRSRLPRGEERTELIAALKQTSAQVSAEIEKDRSPALKPKQEAFR